MKIGIYNESTSDDSILGGSEVVAAVLAHLLKQTGGAKSFVEIVHHRSALQREQLASLAGVDLDAVHLRYLPRQPRPQSRQFNLHKRYEQAKSWHEEVSKPYDVFVAIVHSAPPFCHASSGLLMVLFPFDKSPAKGAAKRRARHYVRHPWNLSERPYSSWEWRKRLESYEHHTGISEFTCHWTKLWWEIDSQVIYPPVDMDFAERAKSNQILSVGRFSGRGVLKRQAEMMETFLSIPRDEINDWRYLCAGGLGDDPADRAFYEDVRAQAVTGGRIENQERAEVTTNLARSDLKRLYETSKVFWHATGWGEDQTQHPELAEHFGISTVEAMAAGCVPVVINKGAQPEIVQHGESGFVWDTPRELSEYTLLLARDEALRAQLSRAARERAQYFSRQMFAQRILSLLSPALATAPTENFAHE